MEAGWENRLGGNLINFIMSSLREGRREREGGSGGIKGFVSTVRRLLDFRLSRVAEFELPAAPDAGDVCC